MLSQPTFFLIKRAILY